MTHCAWTEIMVIVANTWRVLQKAFSTETEDSTVESSGPSHGEFPPITVAERFGAAVLVGATLLIGLYLRLLLDLIVLSLNSPLFDGMWKACALLGIKIHEILLDF